MKAPRHCSVEIPRHYAYVTRMVIDLYHSSALSDVISVEVEPEWGYTTRIRYSNGATRMTYGNDIGLNAGAAADVVRDKAYTKYFLQRLGFDVPRGLAFLLPWWAGTLNEFRRPAKVRTTARAVEYACGELGLPVYVKPVDGTQGRGVSRCESAEDVATAIMALKDLRTKVALVEEAVDLPDYRLVLLNGELISAYRRSALSVIGDGRLTVLALMEAVDAEFQASGRDTRIDFSDLRIVQRLHRHGLSLDSIPTCGEILCLRDISNLSAGGSAEDVTRCIGRRWGRLAREVAASLSLNFCGMDLLCSDITDDAASYSILEVNAAPGLDHYASVGQTQAQVVRDLYAKVLNVPPSQPSGT